MLDLTTGLHHCTEMEPIEQTLTIWEERIVERRELLEYGNRKRTIQLTEEVVKQLRWEHAKHPSSPLCSYTPELCDLTFQTWCGSLHNKISEKAGLDHVRFEDLRHTYAMNALQNGTKVKELAHMLGLERSYTVRKHYGQYILKDEKTTGNVSQPDIELDELKKDSEQIGNILKF